MSISMSISQLQPCSRAAVQPQRLCTIPKTIHEAATADRL
jgi:hypothetical protein